MLVNIASEEYSLSITLDDLPSNRTFSILYLAEVDMWCWSTPIKAGVFEDMAKFEQEGLSCLCHDDSSDGNQMNLIIDPLESLAVKLIPTAWGYYVMNALLCLQT